MGGYVVRMASPYQTHTPQKPMHVSLIARTSRNNTLSLPTTRYSATDKVSCKIVHLVHPVHHIPHCIKYVGVPC
jgi:hypothetical protein